MDRVYNVRKRFKQLFKKRRERGNGTIELRHQQFLADKDSIFGCPNKEYINAEIAWYNTESRSVDTLFNIYGKPVKIWEEVCSEDGLINSNYGWCIFSEDNHNQYEKVLRELRKNPLSRQAVMYYTRPTMHEESKKNGMSDHICTTHCQYFLIDNVLDVQVNMRSSDAIFGYLNDYQWQKYVLEKLAQSLGVEGGKIVWNAGSLHIYERHWNLIK